MPRHTLRHARRKSTVRRRRASRTSKALRRRVLGGGGEEELFNSELTAYVKPDLYRSGLTQAGKVEFDKRLPNIIHKAKEEYYREKRWGNSPDLWDRIVNKHMTLALKELLSRYSKNIPLSAFQQKQQNAAVAHFTRKLAERRAYEDEMAGRLATYLKSGTVPKFEELITTAIANLTQSLGEIKSIKETLPTELKEDILPKLDEQSGKGNTHLKSLKQVLSKVGDLSVHMSIIRKTEGSSKAAEHKEKLLTGVINLIGEVNTFITETTEGLAEIAGIVSTTKSAGANNGSVAAGAGANNGSAAAGAGAGAAPVATPANNNSATLNTLNTLNTLMHNTMDEISELLEHRKMLRNSRQYEEYGRLQPIANQASAAMKAARNARLKNDLHTAYDMTMSAVNTLRKAGAGAPGGANNGSAAAGTGAGAAMANAEY